MALNSDSVRNKLIEITNRGMKLKAIVLNVGVDSNDLSHFKNGRNSLKESGIQIVSAYLNNIVIPQWNMISSKNKK